MYHASPTSNVLKWLFFCGPVTSPLSRIERILNRIGPDWDKRRWKHQLNSARNQLNPAQSYPLKFSFHGVRSISSRFFLMFCSKSAQSCSTQFFEQTVFLGEGCSGEAANFYEKSFLQSSEGTSYCKENHWKSCLKPPNGRCHARWQEVK